jgi:transmembrane sensor
MSRSERIRSQIAADASNWLIRLEDSNVTRADRCAFADWIRESPVHVEEFLAAAEVWSALGSVDADHAAALVAAALASDVAPNVTTLRRPVEAPATTERSPSHRWRRIAAAAFVSAVLISATAWWSRERDSTMHVSTAIGEQRSVALPDGSLVYVNTDSRLVIALTPSRRDVLLEQGEARFEVAKDPSRPFIVATPEARVRAVGTMFNVRAFRDRTTVTVVEGRVAVEAGPSPGTRGDASVPPHGSGTLRKVDLSAGARAAVTAQGTIVPGDGPSVGHVLAWSNRRLLFRDEALSEVIAEFNRYRDVPIVIGSDDIATVRISGSFLANDPSGLIDYLTRYEAIRSERREDGAWILTR